MYQLMKNHLNLMRKQRAKLGALINEKPLNPLGIEKEN